MRWSDLLSTDPRGDAHSEEILNVFRRSEDEMLGNAAVADAVDMSTEGAKRRLQKLEKEGRVNGKKIGRTWVWTLHPDERRKPVPPDIDRLVHGLDWIDDQASSVLVGGLFVTVFGFSLIYWAVTEAFILEPFSGMSLDVLLALGWSLAVAGGLVGITVGLARFGLWLIERVAIRRVTETAQSSPAGKQHGEPRGQVTPRLLLGGFVLIIITGPLATAAVDIQQGLASTPAFSPLTAAVLAVLIIAVIVAAIFEGGR